MSIRRGVCIYRNSDPRASDSEYMHATWAQEGMLGSKNRQTFLPTERVKAEPITASRLSYLHGVI